MRELANIGPAPIAIKSVAVTQGRRLLHPLIKSYWVIWLIAIALALIMPVTASSGSWFFAGFLSLAYVAWSSVIAISFGAKSENVRGLKARSQQKPSSASGARRIIVVGTALAVLGVLFMYFDRVYYQSIDYNESIATARNQMRMAAEVRQGFSSMFSLLGNFLWAFAYVPLAVVLIRWELFRPRFDWSIVGLNLFAIWAIGALNGGRSPILMALGVGFAAICVRKSFGLSGIPKLSKRARIYAWIGAAVVMLYSPYVLIERARLSNLEFRFYTVESIEYLHGKTTDGFALVDRIADAFGSFVYLFLMNLCHLVHQFWVFQDVIMKDERQGSIVFGQAIYYLQKLSFFANVSTEWDFSGVFLPLPGAIYYDFGIPGLIIVGFLHGLALGRSSKILSQGVMNSRQLAAIVIVFSITFLSPFVAIFLIGPFTFMVAAYVIILVFRKIEV